MGDLVEDGSNLEVMLVRDGEVLEDTPVEESVVPKGKTLTEEEYQELVRKGETANSLASPLTGLVEQLGRQQQQPVNVGKPEESDEEFYARMENQAFVPGQFGKVMGEVQKRTLAPVLGQYSGIILDQAKKLMRVDPDNGALFRRFEGEIEREVERIPGQYRHPKVYEEVFQRVLLKHQPEIIKETIEGQQPELEKAILAKYGLDPEKLKKEQEEGGIKPARQAVQSLGQRNSPISMGQGEGKGGLKLFESEAERMSNQGLDPKDPDQVRSWLKFNPRRK